MNFDQILTKPDQILTIYVKNRQIHVKQIQECHFLKIKKIQRQQSPRKKKSKSKINQDLGYWGIWEGNGVYWGGN